MPDDSDQPDSLDREITRTGGKSKADPQSGLSTGDTVASLGEMQTGGDTRSSLSDLGDLEQAADGQEEIVDLESRYEILGPLGRGGMGEVVRAMDQRLKREVAIKRIREEFGTSRQAMQRFLTEAVSIAALNHYNVVQIYDYGHTAEGPFLVMELVEGPTLAELLQDGPLPLVDAAEMVYQLCDGLQAAHDRGLVHRDIKPANILVTGNGTPKLTDFGLAREVTDTGMTRTGAVLGTLDYMAPEQKENASQVDARSDQWSLAATVYQMITGKVPRLIRLNELPETLQPVIVRALEEDPAARYESVREFGQALRETADAATNRTLDRNRPQEGQCTGCGTINAVDRQFCRDCGGSLIEPCPECGTEAVAWEKFCGSCGTDIPAALGARVTEAGELVQQIQTFHSEHRYAEALALIEPLLEAAHPALKPQQEWAWKARDRITGEKAEYEARRKQLLSEARDLYFEGHVNIALQILDRIPEHLRDDESRRLVAEYSMAAEEATRLAAEIGRVVQSRQYNGLAASVVRHLEPDPRDEKARALPGRRQARGGRGESETPGRNGQPAETVPRSFLKWPVLVGAFIVAFVASGGWLLLNRRESSVTTPDQGGIAAHPVAEVSQPPAENFVERENPQTTKPETPEPSLISPEVEPHSTAADADFVVPPGRSSRQSHAAEPPVARPVAQKEPKAASEVPATNETGSAPTKNATEGKTAPAPAFQVMASHVLNGHSTRVSCAVFSPGGRMLATASADRTARLWNVADGLPGHVLNGSPGGVTSVAFSPDGWTLATSSLNQFEVPIWSVANGKLVSSFQLNRSRASYIAISPNGQMLATSGRNVQLWHTDGRLLSILRGHSGTVRSMEFSPDGLTLATGSDDHTVRIWSSVHGRPLRVLTGHTRAISSVAFSPDGRTLATAGGMDRTVRLWNTVNGSLLGMLRGHTASVNSVAFSPDGRILATASSDGTTRLWTMGSFAAAYTLQGHTPSVNFVSFSPDGETLATAGGNIVRLWKIIRKSTTDGT